MARKAGKPNTFFKGMKVDMDPAYQPKSSYRFAQNAKILSNDSDSIAIQPYPSDKEVLSLCPEIVTVAENIAGVIGFGDITTYSFGLTSPEGGDMENYAIGQTGWFDHASLYPVIANENGFPIIGSIPATIFDNNIAPIPVVSISNNSDSTSLNESFLLQANLTLSNGAVQTLFFNAGSQSLFTNTTLNGSPYSLNSTIATAINSNNWQNEDGSQLENAETITAFNVPVANELEPDFQQYLAQGNYTNSVIYDGTDNMYFFNQTSPSNSVTGLTINVAGNVYSGSVFQQWYYGILNVMLEYVYNVFSNYTFSEIQQQAENLANYIIANAPTDSMLAQANDLQMGWEGNNVFVDGAPGTDVEGPVTAVSIINNNSLTPITDLTDYQGDNVTIDDDIFCINILGTYSFSDYVILLGKWPLLQWAWEVSNPGWEEAGMQFPGNDNVVLKVKQDSQGKLTGLNGGDFDLYFIGNLQLEADVKVKLTGAEENDKTRRIYFTDGVNPLKTMNVALSSDSYSPYALNPEYFNVFAPAIFSNIEVEGFNDGGGLDSVAHSYAYRYVTIDGRVSQWSMFSNPASVPVSSKSTNASYVKGGAIGTNTGKSLKLKIEKLDTRYNRIEVIHMPYLDGVPVGPGKVFADLSIPAVTDGGNTIRFTHTGNEEIDTEINIANLEAQGVVWTTCKAIETKDNRLFAGNLSGKESLEITTDFTVKSYNQYNQTYNENYNPHLYDDLLYSSSGVDYTEGSTQGIPKDSNTDNNESIYQDSPHAIYGEEHSSFYRYIQRIDSGTPNPDTALYNQSMSSIGGYNGYNIDSGSYETKRGVWGSESLYFNTPIPSGENVGQNEGVRVTFRVLGSSIDDPASPVELDETGKLNASGQNGWVAKPPFYKVSVDGDADNFYANYSNPIYNSKYVGYQRGEVYRFGILFYDKQGSPMFVKRIGDVRMPEHSTEVLVPNFDAQGNVVGFSNPWPYNYQTARDPKDQGFKRWDDLYNDADYNVPYNPQEYDGNAESFGYLANGVKKGVGGNGNYAQSKACVLYPYFEVKLSEKTTKNIGGYSIVRVPRDAENRTVLATGLLNRAVNYDWNIASNEWGSFSGPYEMENKFGIDSHPYFTRIHQWIWGLPQANHQGESGFIEHGMWVNNAIYGPKEVLGTNNDNDQWYNFPEEGNFWADNEYSNNNLENAAGIPSNVYTLDSPDALLNDNSTKNFPPGCRLKLIEQLYCQKQNTNKIESDDVDGVAQMMQYYGDADYNSGGEDEFYPSASYDANNASHYRLAGKSLNLFACTITPDLLDGETIVIEDEEVDTGSWRFKFPDYHISGNAVSTYGGWTGDAGGNGDYTLGINFDAQIFANTIVGDGTIGNEQGYGSNNEGAGIKLALYTKLYNKAIPGYPFYGLYRVDGIGGAYGNNDVSGDNTVVGCNRGQNNGTFFLGAGDPTSNPGQGGLFTFDYNWTGQWDGNFNYHPPRAQGLVIDQFLNNSGYIQKHSAFASSAAKKLFPESNISFAKTVGPGETVSSGSLTSSTDFKNRGAYVWPGFQKGHRASLPLLSQMRGGDGNGQQNPHANAGGMEGINTIVFSLPQPGAIPVTRNCVHFHNKAESVHDFFGGEYFFKNTWSPEVPLASIVKNQTKESMYGGYSLNSFNKNKFSSTGHFRPVGNALTGEQPNSVKDVGRYDGNHVFGGDIFICNHQYRRGHDADVQSPHDNAVFWGVTYPVEAVSNLDLRHGTTFGNNSSDIPRYLEDDKVYNESYSSENQLKKSYPTPTDFVEVFRWPSTVAWSEVKYSADVTDAYSIFPVNQVRDLDYEKGEITKLFKVQDTLFATQHSGTAKLSVNPRVMIKTDEDSTIQAATGTDTVIDRYDYVSERLGSQHFHGLALSDSSAYYYDDNNNTYCKLTRGRSKQGQLTSWVVKSLGDELGMQSYFNDYKDLTINDNPLTIYSPAVIIGDNSTNNYHDEYHYMYQDYVAQGEKRGGISLGFDPESSEVLLTIASEEHVARTIVYNEKVDLFTTFLSKRPTLNFNFKGRMYSSYLSNTNSYVNNRNNKLFLSNGYENFEDTIDEGAIYKYLSFGGFDYYVWQNNTATNSNNEPLYNSPVEEAKRFNWANRPHGYISQENYDDINNYREPFQFEIVFNDEPFMSKVFDKSQIMFETASDLGSRNLYFRKFAMLGSANRYPIVEQDRIDDESSSQWTDNDGNVFNPYSTVLSTQDGGIGTLGLLGDVGYRTWYEVKDNIHYAPMRRANELNVLDEANSLTGLNLEPTVRGVWARVIFTVGWKDGINFTYDVEEGNIQSNESQAYGITAGYAGYNLKDEKFSIFSILPHYRKSKH